MKHHDQLLVEPRAAAIVGTPSHGPIKSILFSVHDDEALLDRLQCVLSMARACSAHLTLLQVVPIDACNVTDVYGSAYVSGEIMAAFQEQADKVRARLEEHLRKEDVSWTFVSETSVIVPELLRSAALADLIFIGREPRFHEFSRTGLSLLGELVCNARTPICIPGDGATSFDPFGTAVIAWNGSIEAANAVRETVGMLKLASEVRVLRFVEDRELLLDDMQLLEYLSRHDVHAKFDSQLPGRTISAELLDYVRRVGAEYVVIGGYSHSRAGEFLFGGVTRELLRACPVSIVMAH